MNTLRPVCIQKIILKPQVGLLCTHLHEFCSFHRAPVNFCSDLQLLFGLFREHPPPCWPRAAVTAVDCRKGLTNNQVHGRLLLKLKTSCQRKCAVAKWQMQRLKKEGFFFNGGSCCIIMTTKHKAHTSIIVLCGVAYWYVVDAVVSFFKFFFFLQSSCLLGLSELSQGVEECRLQQLELKQQQDELMAKTKASLLQANTLKQWVTVHYLSCKFTKLAKSITYVIMW